MFCKMIKIYCLAKQDDIKFYVINTTVNIYEQKVDGGKDEEAFWDFICT